MHKTIEQELRRHTLGSLNPGHLKFFEPNVIFLNWMQARFRGRRVYDVGAGHGHVAKALNGRGVITLPIDMSYREHAEMEVAIADATCYPFKPNTVVMLCRPCHGNFVADVIEQAIHCKVSTILYVGKVSNASGDLDKYQPEFRPMLADAGNEDETVYKYKVNHAQSR